MKINDWKIQSRLLQFICKKHNFIMVTFFSLLIFQLLMGREFWFSALTGALIVWGQLLLIKYCYQQQWWIWPFAGSIQKFPAFKPRPLYEVVGQCLSFHASDVKKIIFQFSQASVNLKVNNHKNGHEINCKAQGDARFLAAKINDEIFISPIGSDYGNFQLEFPPRVLVVVSGRKGEIIAQQAPNFLQVYLQQGMIKLAETRLFCSCQLASGNIEINNARGEVQVNKGVANMVVNFSPRATQGKIFFESGAGTNEIGLPAHALLNSFVDCSWGNFSSDYVSFWKNGTFIVKGISWVGDTRVKNLAKQKPSAKVFGRFWDAAEFFLLQSQKARD